MMDRDGAEPELVIVVPAFNEAAVLEAFHTRLAAVLGQMNLRSAALYVDDGSTDATWSILGAIAEIYPWAGAIRLSRNFGKEAALTAGLDHLGNAAVVVIDADLQDPPELIPQLVARWQAGADVVYATRASRDGETALKKATSASFYRVMEWLSPTPVPRDTGDFRIMSARAAAAVRQLRERQRFMKGLFAWVGFRQESLVYARDPRYAGETKWNYLRLANLAMEGITSFSTVPLRLASYLGGLVAACAFAYGAWVVAKAALWGDPVKGYPTLMAVILFLGGVQLLALGVIGEYIGRTYAEVKQRPLYLVDTHLNVRLNRVNATIQGASTLMSPSQPG